MQERVPNPINEATQDVHTSAWRARIGSSIVLPARLLDESVSDQSVRVFAAVAELDYTPDGCYMAVTNLAERLQVDRGTVHRALTELRTRGFIRRIRTRDGRDGWKVARFPFTGDGGGFALVEPCAVRKLISARHFRAYAICQRAAKRREPITAPRVARSLVNRGTSRGRDRAAPARCSHDTAQRVLEDLAAAGWLVPGPRLPGMAIDWQPQKFGGDEVRRDNSARRAPRKTADADLSGDSGDTSEASAGHEPDGEAVHSHAESADAAPGGENPDTAAPDAPGTPPDGSSPEEQQVTAPETTGCEACGVVHSPTQPCHAVTDRSHSDPAQRRHTSPEQLQHTGLRNGAALEELARRASSEAQTDVRQSRNGPVVDGPAPDDFDHESGEDGSDPAERPDDARPGPDHDGSDDGSDDDGDPRTGLRQRLEQVRDRVREHGPQQRPDEPAPPPRRAALRTELDRVRRAGPGSWGRYQPAPADDPDRHDSSPRRRPSR